MKRSTRDVFLMSALSVATIGFLAGCQRQAPPDEAAQPAPAPGASAPQVSQQAVYQPPTAEQLYALVSPIALFPDKLVALTLAASTHQDDVNQARSFLEGNRNLTGAALIDAADAQPWDPSVKALVAFPAVVDQLATNADWTAALGAAYAAEPTDVMNAIQVMRQRARAHGSLKDSAQQKVQVVETAPAPAAVEERRIVEAPAETIEIEPSQSDVVYVPQYDPDVVYGEPVYSTVYSERWYSPPVSRGDLVATGLVSFGVGVLVGELFAHGHHDHPWGWNAWNTSWGGSRGGGFSRPAVVYDNHPYVVNRNTVINNYTNVNRSVNIDNRHNFGNVNNIHNNNAVNNSVNNVTNNNIHNHFNNGQPGAGAPAQGPADFAHMQRPNFSPQMMRATAPNERPNLPPQARPGAEGFQRNAAVPGAGPQSPQGAPGQPHAPNAMFRNDHAVAPQATQAPHVAPRMDMAAPPHPQQVPHNEARVPPANAPQRPEPRNEGPRPEQRAEQQQQQRAQQQQFQQQRAEQQERIQQQQQQRMEQQQHMEQRAQPPRQEPRNEPRPEQRPQPRPQEHHEEKRAPEHEHDKHDN